MKILVIVPAYNEEESLPGVVADLRAHVPAADVLVVNDGSRDATARVARELGVTVTTLPFNLGIGGAVQTGYRYALHHGYDVAVQFDGDGQHLAQEVGKLLDPVLGGTADLVVGSRFLNEGDYRAPVLRRSGMRVFSSILSCILGKRMTDTTSGFRACNRRVIEFFSRTYPEDYPEVEALVLLHKAGYGIAERAVAMQRRSGGKSSITAARAVYYMIKVLLAVFVDLIKKTR